MKQNLMTHWRAFWRAYHRLVVRPAWVRVDPLTLLTLLAFLLGMWSAGTSEQTADQLLTVPDQARARLETMYADGLVDDAVYADWQERISAYEEEAQAMLDVFTGQPGADPTSAAIIQMSVVGAQPVESAVVSPGQAFDLIFSAWNLANGHSIGLAGRSYDPVQVELHNLIMATASLGIDPFFDARMRVKVNELKNAWIDLVSQYDFATAQAEYRALLDRDVEKWAAMIAFGGENLPWGTEADFEVWLNDRAMDAVAALNPALALYPSSALSAPVTSAPSTGQSAGQPASGGATAGAEQPVSGPGTMTIERGLVFDIWQQQGVAASMYSYPVVVTMQGQTLVLTAPEETVTMPQSGYGTYVGYDSGGSRIQMTVVNPKQLSFEGWQGGNLIAGGTITLN